MYCVVVQGIGCRGEDAREDERVYLGHLGVGSQELGEVVAQHAHQEHGHRDGDQHPVADVAV